MSVGRALGLLTLILAASGSAAVFQYAVPVEAGGKPGKAFLWLPPEASRVRGVVMAGMTLAEREIVKDERIRRACAEEQLAIVFIKAGFDAVSVHKVLDDLANASGYQELKVAPLFFIGHSAGGPPAKELAMKMADRCFGLMQYRGGTPGPNPPLPPGIPALAMVGQFDDYGGLMRAEDGREGAWERPREDFVAWRAQDPANVGSIAVEPGAGHFAWSDRNAELLALFIKKAAQARIPDWPVSATEPVQCKKIDPANGWLTSLMIEREGEPKPAAAADYAGDPAKTAWHFDEEMAKATAAYHAGLRGKKDQFIRWEDPTWVDAGTRFFFTKLTWVGDGQTLEVHPVYAETYPKPQENGGPRWGEAGQPVGHSSAPILVRTVSGPLVATGPHTLRVQFDGLAEEMAATFLAYRAGDAEYRHTEQVGMLPRGFSGLGEGKEQTISWPKLENIRADSPPLELKAVSDAGLPVEYYVADGPAKIAGGKLEIAEVPRRATFPIEVKVVAWQFGRGNDPKIKTAKRAEQTIQIERP